MGSFGGDLAPGPAAPWRDQKSAAGIGAQLTTFPTGSGIERGVMDRRCWERNRDLDPRPLAYAASSVS
jgi:hypothetical protein